MNLTRLIENKKVLFIPVYSMRDRVTNQYDLSKDGNFHRIESLLYSAKCKSATVLIPENAKLATVLPNAIKFEKCWAYGKNARETRDEFASFVAFLDSLDLRNFDLIISEPNEITRFLANSSLSEKTIYWCVASITTEGTPWFVKDFVDIDKDIASKILTAVSSKSQVEALGGKAFFEESFYDASLFDYETIFFPFRLTDESYHAQEFAEIIEKLEKDKTLKPFKVLYTDVNNSSLFDELSDRFVKVSSDHDTYLQILKGKPIIPYLENMDIVEHISINEFIYYDCKVIGLNCRHKKVCHNIIYINEIDELYETLKSLLRRRDL